MKKQFEDILADFEPVTELEQKETVNGGILVCYGVGLYNPIADIIGKKYTIGPKP